MEIYRLYVHYRKETNMVCNCVCPKVDDNWSEETYYLGPNGFETAMKELNNIKNADYYTTHIEFDECEVDFNSGKIKKTRTIDEYWKTSSGWV